MSAAIAQQQHSRVGSDAFLTTTHASRSSPSTESGSALLSISIDGRIVSAENTRSMLGFDSIELVGRKLSSLLWSPYKEHYEALITAFWKEGRHESLLAKPTLVEMEHKDIRKTNVKIMITRIQQQDKTTLMAFIEKSKEVGAMITTNASGTILSCNEIEPIFGYTFDKLIHKPLSFLLPFYQVGRKDGSSSSSSSPPSSPAPTTNNNHHLQQQQQGTNEIANVLGKHQTGGLFWLSLQMSTIKVGTFELFSIQLKKLDASLEALFTVNKQELIVSCDPLSVFTLFGYRAQELVGQPLKHIVTKKGLLLGSLAREGPITNNNTTTNGSTPILPQASPTSSQQPSPVMSIEESDTTIPTTITITTTTTNHHNYQHVPSPLEPVRKRLRVSSNTANTTTPPSSPILSSSSLSSTSNSNNNNNNSNSSSVPLITHVRHKDGSIVPISLQAFPFRVVVSSSSNNNNIIPSATTTTINNNNIINNNTTTINNNNNNNKEEGEMYYSVRMGRLPLGDSPNSRIGEYLLMETLGRGSSGKVKRAIHVTTNDQVAIKIISKGKLSVADLERAHRETQIMLKLKHQHIVQLYDVMETPQKLYLVMEYVNCSDLMKYVLSDAKKIHKNITINNSDNNNNIVGLEEKEAKNIFVQLVSALRYCHQMNVIHRDVKHKNILIDKTTQQIKVIDFGLSNWAEDGNGTLKSSYCGTPAFAAPELILGKKYEGKLVDVWSAAVVLYSLLTERFPFTHVGELLLGTFEDPPHVSPECCDLLRHMLVVDPQQRYTLQQVWDHPWVRSSTSSSSDS